MRKLIVGILLITTSISCNKELGDLIYNEAIPGGCFLDKGKSPKSDQIFENDTVKYSFINDNLDLFVGFNTTCCSEYSASSKINGDTICIEILATQIGLCNCICYYTYNFKFLGSGNNYKYQVTIDNYKTFSGEIKP
jgi:hypothetical protein